MLRWGCLSRAGVHADVSWDYPTGARVSGHIGLVLVGWLEGLGPFSVDSTGFQQFPAGSADTPGLVSGFPSITV